MAGLSAIVLAAGEGTRMHSQRPKPLHHICGRPMVLHVIDAVSQLDVDRVVVVVGHEAEWVIKSLTERSPEGLRIEFVEQPEQLGTGDAVSVGLAAFDAADEELDASDEERAETEVNTSIFMVKRALLGPALRRLDRTNSQSEYYLTDVVSVLYNA